MPVEPDVLLLIKSACGFVGSLAWLVIVLVSHDKLLATPARRWGFSGFTVLNIAVMALTFNDVMAMETRGFNFYAAGVGLVNFLTALICQVWFWYSRHRKLAVA